MNAFSPDGTFKDSSMFLDEMVEHTTSWLTINPFKGCSLGCAYCFRLNWHSSNVPEHQVEVEEAVEALLSHPKFVPNVTPVSINISSTDALLPIVRNSTFGAIKLFESKGLRNPFGITTKLFFKPDEILFLESLEFVRPIVFVSLAFIPENIEPTPVKPRIKNLENFSKSKVPCILYLRPIVEGWNDSIDILDKALTLGQRFADAVCIGSLRMSDQIRESLTNSSAIPGEQYVNFHNKIIETDIETKILSNYKRLKCTIPLFKHTSCAVSYFMKTPNYNNLYLNPSKNCLDTCPSKQQAICKAQIK